MPLAKVEDAEIIQLDESSIAAIDLGGWTPSVHFLTGQQGHAAADLSSDLRAIGLTQSRKRMLQLRETRLLRSEVGCGMCAVGMPQSVAIDAELTAGERIASGVAALAEAQVTCTGVALRSSSPVDPDAVSRVVRLLYGVGQHRVRLMFRAADVSSQLAREKLVSVLRDLWSIQPVMEVSWGEVDVDVLREPIWHELATRIRIRGYATRPPEEVWSWISGSRCDVETFEVSDDVERRSAEVKWLVEAYERDLVGIPEVCSPYAEVLAAFREPRAPAPRCVRLQGRRLLIDETGNARCCPTAPPIAEWKAALVGGRHWNCAMSWISRMATGCCNPGRLTRRDCRGTETGPCPEAACEFARTLLPVLLRRLRDSMVESPT